jgi:hypothetical protein
MPDNHRDIISAEVRQNPAIWEDNWYRTITGIAVIVGIYATLNK